MGPTLASFGVSGVLPNPYLQLFNSAGTLFQANNDWAGNTLIASDELTEQHKAPGNPAESVLWPILAAGGYTAQLSGAGGVTGIGLLELYEY